jgi:hypothetical protein
MPTTASTRRDSTKCGHLIERVCERRGLVKQRRDVTEQNARLREVGNVADVLLQVHAAQGIGRRRRDAGCRRFAADGGPQNPDRRCILHEDSHRIQGSGPTLPDRASDATTSSNPPGAEDHGRSGDHPDTPAGPPVAIPADLPEQAKPPVR